MVSYKSPGFFVIFRAVVHERQLVCCMELDQAARRGLVVQHFGPAIVGKDPLDKVLTQRHVVEPALFFQGQQGKSVHQLARERAGAVSLRYSMLIIHFHTE